MNNDDLGCLGTIIVVILVLLFFGGNIALFSGDTEDMGLAIGVAVIADSAIAIWLLSVIGKAVGSSHEKRHEKNLIERKEIVVKEVGSKISHRNEIQQTFDRHFEKIERQFSLVSLISSCMGNNNQELKTLLFDSKEDAFESTKKEIFDKLSKDEKKRFPKTVADVIDYKKILEQESADLTKDLNSVACANEEYLYEIMQKHCPDMYKSIKRKKRNLITAIVVPIVIIIVSSILLSSSFALNLAKDYHLSVLEEKLVENEFTTYSITSIDYEKQYKYSYDDDGITTYDIKDIMLKYEKDFSNQTEDELKKTLRRLYSNLKVGITYRWAQHNLSFETDKYYYNIILIDKDGDRCSYDGKYFDIDE